MAQELTQAIGRRSLTLEFEGALKADADEKLQIMSETCHQREKFLGDTKFPNPSLLCLGK